MKTFVLGLSVTALSAIAVGAHRPASAGATVPLGSFVQEPDGKQLYLANCKQCHGVLGKPTKASLRKYDSIPSLADPQFYEEHDDAELIDAIANGKGRDMKGFKDKLSPAEIAAVVRYIHTLAKEP